MPPVNQNPSQGIAAIAGGPTNWGNMPQGWLAQMAADIASRGGMAVQQNGYDATAAVPVAAGPAWAGPSPVPAYPQSGANMTMPGSREAWQQWGIPPVVMQSSPYATAAYRTYTDPYGQLGVQPLIGFPSAYPNVLSGVPNSPFRVQGFINSLLPQMGFMPFMGMQQTPAQPKAQGGAPAPKRSSSQPVAPPPVAAGNAPALSGTMEISAPVGVPPVFPEYSSRLDRFAQDNIPAYSHHNNAPSAAPDTSTSYTAEASGGGSDMQSLLQVMRSIMDLGNPLNLGVDLARSVGVLPQ